MLVPDGRSAIVVVANAMLVCSTINVQRAGATHAAPGEPARAPAPVTFPERFVVKIGVRTVLVPVAEIRWIQSDGNYADLLTAFGRQTIRETLASIESRLDPTQFVRVHQRVIIAISFIRELQPWFGGD